MFLKREVHATSTMLPQNVSLRKWRFVSANDTEEIDRDSSPQMSLPWPNRSALHVCAEVLRRTQSNSTTRPEQPDILVIGFESLKQNLAVKVIRDHHLAPGKILSELLHYSRLAFENFLTRWEDVFRRTRTTERGDSSFLAICLFILVEQSFAQLGHGKWTEETTGGGNRDQRIDDAAATMLALFRLGFPSLPEIQKYLEQSEHWELRGKSSPSHH